MLDKLKTYPLAERESKVRVEDFAKRFYRGGSFREFMESLPRIMAGKDFMEIVARTVQALKSHRLVIFAMGAHVIKVGLSPVIIDMMQRGILSAIALNGAGLIHDFEVAFAGATSEDVEKELETGSFGMAGETALFLNEAINAGTKEGKGIGLAVGEYMLEKKFPYNPLSILAQARSLNIPITVHVALGTDTIHFHPSAEWASIGKGCWEDFKTFVSLVAQLEKGVYFNVGSAVVLPEVFLKAISIVRNLGHKVEDFTGVNLDFLTHYRPTANVVRRPFQKGGKGFSLIGHHEILIPLLAAALAEEMG